MIAEGALCPPFREKDTIVTKDTATKSEILNQENTPIGGGV